MNPVRGGRWAQPRSQNQRSTGFDSWMSQKASYARSRVVEVRAFSGFRRDALF